MPRTFSRIPVIDETDDLEMLREQLNVAIAEINSVFLEAEVEINAQRGNTTTGQVASSRKELITSARFNSDVNMSRKRVKNAERSKDPRDYVIREELTELGILGQTGGISLKGDVNIDGTISITGTSGGGGELATGQDVVDTATTIVGANVATSNPGDRVVIEDGFGANGTTQGTLAMLRDRTSGKAIHGEAINGQHVVIDLTVATTLALILECLQEIKHELAARG